MKLTPKEFADEFWHIYLNAAKAIAAAFVGTLCLSLLFLWQIAGWVLGYLLKARAAINAWEPVTPDVFQTENN